MSDRVVTNPPAMADNWRVAMTALTNLFLTMHRNFSTTPVGAPGPTELLIYATIAVANVQRLMRERRIPSEFTATAILPREWVVPISRNAIASASGLPRETVRRQVARMIAQGVLMDDERGGVTVVPGMIDTLGLAPLLENMLADFTRTADALLRAGVIVVESGERDQVANN
ncbi:MAG: hypothetical protein M3R41_08055 [Pseudomonadota bacterium]|nr:hypothetical protein [Pseudomonadota bacterium]